MEDWREARALEQDEEDEESESEDEKIEESKNGEKTEWSPYSHNSWGMTMTLKIGKRKQRSSQSFVMNDGY